MSECPYGGGDHRELIRQAKAEERERIAQAIEDNPGPDPSPASPAWWAGWTEGQADAARIARGVSDEPGEGA